MPQDKAEERLFAVSVGEMPAAPDASSVDFDHLRGCRVKIKVLFELRLKGCTLYSKHYMLQFALHLTHLASAL